MEQVYRIRNMKKFEGKSLREISQITGHDFETVKKYIEKDDFNLTLRPKQRRKSKLSPYRTIVNYNKMYIIFNKFKDVVFTFFHYNKSLLSPL